MKPLARAVLVAALIAMVWSSPTHRVPARAATPAAATSALYAVAARSSGDVWAVGTKGYPSAGAPSYIFVAHWDGTRWRDVSPVLGCTREMAADVGLGALCAAAPKRGLSATLMGVAALSNGEVWAVGSKLGLVLHWDGSRWQVAWWDQAWNTLPQDVGAVAAVSPRDVWATGDRAATPPRPGLEALVEHWDGVRWQTVPVSGTSVLGVAALSRRDVWAVGSGDQGGLIEHWDGVRWRVVYEPGPHRVCCSGIAALARDDVWAAGGSLAPNPNVALHWDGRHWQSLVLPVVKDSLLWTLTAISAYDVWAVGTVNASTHPKTLIEHWDGVRWRVVPSPNVAGHANFLFGVAGVSARDVWAVGRVGGYDSDATSKALIEHWDGVRWSIVPS